MLAFHGQHAFALGTVIALAEPRPDVCWRRPSRLVATASETSAAIRNTSFAAASDCEGTRFYESRPKISGRRDAADRSDIGADRVVEATMLQTFLAAWARSIILSARSTSPAQDIGLMEISQRVRHFCASLICATSAPSRSLASTAAAFFEAARGRGGGGGKGVYKKLPITGQHFRP